MGIRINLKSKRTEYILLVCVIGVIICVAKWGADKYESELATNGCFTRATTDGTTFEYRTGIVVKYYFFYNGTRYTGTESNHDGVNVSGGTYWVKFSKNDPTVNDIFFLDDPFEGTNGQPCIYP